MALADGGELVIIAPGLKRFGEQPEVDALIRKYGYVRHAARSWSSIAQNADMQDLAHATAHLIHGSSEGRFTITYAPGHLTRAEIEGVNFALRRYQRNDRPLPARALQAGLEHHRRRRAVLLHPHALRRPVGHAREALQPPQRLRPRVGSKVALDLRCDLQRLCGLGQLPGFVRFTPAGVNMRAICDVGFHAGEN